MDWSSGGGGGVGDERGASGSSSNNKSAGESHATTPVAPVAPMASVEEVLAPPSATTALEGLHPRWPTETRVAVVGGGPSGLAAAWALERLGYQCVTVLEAMPTVGGMCESVEIDGRMYDLGGQVLAQGRAPTVEALRAEAGVELEDLGAPRQMAVTPDGAVRELDVFADFAHMVPLTAKLQAEVVAAKSRQGTGAADDAEAPPPPPPLGVHAVSALASAPIDKFLLSAAGAGTGTGTAAGSSSSPSSTTSPSTLPLSVAAAFTGSGYGYPDHTPYAYLHEFCRTALLGRIRRVRGGYASLWQRLAAASLSDVRCNARVTAIVRRHEPSSAAADDGDKDLPPVTVRGTYDSGTGAAFELHFDKVIVTGSLPFRHCPTYPGDAADHTAAAHGDPTNGVLELTPTERALFARVRTVDYYTTVAQVSGLDRFPAGFFYFQHHLQNPSTAGRPVAMQRFFPDTDIFLFWSYGAPGGGGTDQMAAEAAVTAGVRHEVTQVLGGRVDRVVLQRRWAYFPHVGAADMAAGFYDRLQAVQGGGGGSDHTGTTFYAGGLWAFELTERTAAFGIHLVARHFGSSTIVAPYVKRLLQVPYPLPPPPAASLPSYDVQPVGHPPGVPADSVPGDLPSLDAYVRHYAAHPATRAKTVYTWLDERGRETDARTYAQLHARAGAVAKRLKQCVKPGDRVLLLHPPGLHFVDAFLGCLRARVLAVPLIPPDPTGGGGGAGGQALVKVGKVAAACGAVAVLATSGYRAAVRAAELAGLVTGKRSGGAAWWPDLPWHCTDTWTTSNGGRSGRNGWAAWVVDKVTSSLPSSPRSPLSPTKTDAEDGDEDEEEDEEQGKLVEGPCFLQFTSGSTGESKGVIITHAALAHNLALMRRAYRAGSATVLVSWLPQYHDMGLIGGLLTALVAGGTAVLFSPTAFIRAPLMWVRALSDYRATHSAAPNFAFDLVLRRLEAASTKTGVEEERFDLSELRFLMVSAEPVRHVTLRRFLARFADSGLREQILAPGYGLAENCVFVCTAYGARRPVLLDAHSRVCCGFVARDHPDMDIRIVDPATGTEVQSGDEGEIWVSSPSAAAGYWGLPDLTAATFHNTLASGSTTGTRRYTRTGDLGRVVGDALFVTGRIKDLIIVAGRNVYPSDVERTVEEACGDALRPGCSAAFQVLAAADGAAADGAAESAEAVVVATEVRDERAVRGDEARARELEGRIKAAVAAEHGVQVAHVRLLRPRTIAKTSSGKIRRGECLSRFLDGRLQLDAAVSSHAGGGGPHGVMRRSESAPLIMRRRPGSAGASPMGSPRPPPPATPPPAAAAAGRKKTAAAAAPGGRIRSRAEIEAFVVRVVAERTGVPAAQVSPTAPLTSYGIDSVGVVWAASKLSHFLGAHVAAIDVYAAGSGAELAATAHALLLSRGGGGGAAGGDAGGGDDDASALADHDDSTQGSATAADDSDEDDDSAAAAQAPPPSTLRLACISALQLLGTLYIAALLTLPAALTHSFLPHHLPFPLALLLLPAARLAYLALLALLTALTAPLIRPNPALHRAVPLWTLDYARWWTCYRLADMATTHAAGPALRGTPFLGLWYRALGARVGAGAVLDSVDVADPAVVRVADGAVVAEGATVLGHEVRGGSVRVSVVKVGKGGVVGAYAMVQRGASVEAGARVPALARIGVGQRVKKTSAVQDEGDDDDVGGAADDDGRWMAQTAWQVGGLYVVGMVAVLAALVGYLVFLEVLLYLWGWSSQGGAGTGVQQQVWWWSRWSVFWAAAAATLPWPVAPVTPLLALLAADGGSAETTHFSFHLSSSSSDYFALLAAAAAGYTAYALALAAATVALKRLLLGDRLASLMAKAGALTPTTDVNGGSTTKAPKTVTVALTSELGRRLWLTHALLAGAHAKVGVFLSGTPAAAAYLRALGATLGARASVRGVNAVMDPDLLLVGDAAHLGDCARLLTSVVDVPRGGRRTVGQATAGCYRLGVVRVGARCVVGAGSVVMPGASMEDGAVLGANSVAATGAVLRRGGVYVGGGGGSSSSVVMVEERRSTKSLSSPQPAAAAVAMNGHHHHTNGKVNADAAADSGDFFDDPRIREMDPLYRKIVANLAASIAKTTLSVDARYFHRLGVTGKGTLTLYPTLTLPNGGTTPRPFPAHDLLAPGATYPVLLRHSNSLSGDDDARSDARGASLRILRPDLPPAADLADSAASLLDLTLKSGAAFHCATMLQFVDYMMKSHAEREAFAAKHPRCGAASWDSLRLPDSYTHLHYYSNLARLFRASPGAASASDAAADQSDHDLYYVQFRLRPADPRFTPAEARVAPFALIPPETGAVPRAPDDARAPRFLADDFRRRLLDPAGEGITYVLSVALRPVEPRWRACPAADDDALDCTKPWDEARWPWTDVGEVRLRELLDEAVAEKVRFNPANGPASLDMVPATSATQCASVDHGRSVAYDVAQYLRTGKRVPKVWADLLAQSDVPGLEIPDTGRNGGGGGCPAAMSVLRMQAGKSGGGDGEGNGGTVTAGDAGCESLPPAGCGPAACAIAPGRYQQCYQHHSLLSAATTTTTTTLGKKNAPLSSAPTANGHHHAAPTPKTETETDEDPDNLKAAAPPNPKPNSLLSFFYTSLLLPALFHWAQPLLQLLLPVFLLALATFPSLLALSFFLLSPRHAPTTALLLLLPPVAYLLTGLLFTAYTILTRRILLPRQSLTTAADATTPLWSLRSLRDTAWQSANLLLAHTFLDLAKGTLLAPLYLRALGAAAAGTAASPPPYLDTLHALNPDLLALGAGAAVGRNALVFGHLYDGGARHVWFKGVRVGGGCHVGARALLLPGVHMDDGAELGALALGMKAEHIAAY